MPLYSYPAGGGKAKEKILRYKPAQKVIIMHPSGEGKILGRT